MIATLVSTFLGLLAGTLPDVFKIFRDRADRAHELKLLEMQMKMQEQGHTERLEEINVNADISESRALYKTYNVGVAWVDALNGTVRPVLAYSFFFLYATVKIMQINALGAGAFTDTPWLVWNQEDQVIFAGIVSFYFGSRAMQRARDKAGR